LALFLPNAIFANKVSHSLNNIEGSGYNLINGESDLTVYYAGQYYDIRISNITNAFKDVKKKAVGDA
jgi:hypothetical protein